MGKEPETKKGLEAKSNLRWRVPDPQTLNPKPLSRKPQGLIRGPYYGSLYYPRGTLLYNPEDPLAWQILCLSPKP